MTGTLDTFDILKRNMRAIGFYCRHQDAIRDIAAKRTLYRMLWGVDMPAERVLAMVERDIGPVEPWVTP